MMPNIFSFKTFLSLKNQMYRTYQIYLFISGDNILVIRKFVESFLGHIIFSAIIHIILTILQWNWERIKIIKYPKWLYNKERYYYTGNFLKCTKYQIYQLQNHSCILQRLWRRKVLNIYSSLLYIEKIVNSVQTFPKGIKSRIHRIAHILNILVYNSL